MWDSINKLAVIVAIVAGILTTILVIEQSTTIKALSSIISPDLLRWVLTPLMLFAIAFCLLKLAALEKRLQKAENSLVKKPYVSPDVRTHSFKGE